MSSGVEHQRKKLQVESTTLHTPPPAAPPNAAIAAAEAAVAEAAVYVTSLRKELDEAKKKVTEWSDKKFSLPPGTERDTAVEALGFYADQAKSLVEQVAAAQAALDKANALLLEKEKLQLKREELAAAVANPVPIAPTVANPVPIAEVVDKELAGVAWPLQKDKFVTGKRLIDFNATNDKQKCTVLLAPSGAGKTRKLCELLNEKLGYFVPYKLGNDKNYGSEALSAVVSLLGRDPTIDWNKKDPVRDPS
ncbi:hypothetical protein BASA62_002761 [Batrachochytrium salamandrivorans]|nr:hypothetical protein BASA62_002761 [Batrachochytrium salamandrivorans]